MKVVKDAIVAGLVSLIIASFAISAQWGSTQQSLESINQNLEKIDEKVDNLGERVRGVELEVGILSTRLEERTGK